MAKKAKRVPFESTEKGQRENKRTRRGLQEEVPNSGFFRSASTRETFESIVVAIMLALIFKTFEVEAFVIPTGSMAPTLQGRHHDIDCPKCGFRYRTGISPYNSSTSVETEVSATFCPICRYGLELESRKKNPDHGYYSGDRILVNKFSYDFADPERWDVIVFKNPNNAKQNYIKRLVGLPNEALLIENGDVFTWDQTSGSYEERAIARKSPDKLRVMLQVVDDNRYIPDDLKDVDWPLRWQQWANDGSTTQWEVDDSGNVPTYRIEGTGDEPQWLRYRHIVPRTSDWEAIEEGSLERSNIPVKGAYIWDHYCYNERISPKSDVAQGFRNLPFDEDKHLGLYSEEKLGTKPIPFINWVGDLAVETEIEISSASGTLFFDLVEGGAHFICSIDVSSGTTKLSCKVAKGLSDNDGGKVEFVDSSGSSIKVPETKCSIDGAGKYRIRYANVDNAIYLWVNDKPVKFGEQQFQAYRRSGKLHPTHSESDAGDAEPIGIASQNVELTVNYLRVLRDIYYVSLYGQNEQRHNEYDFNFAEPYRTQVYPRQLFEFSRNPEMWSNQRFQDFLATRYRSKEHAFLIKENAYFPMGDNSPSSQDARIWDGPNYVEEDFMIGKALFVYWPHSLNRPIPYFPNFWDMKFIK